MTPQTTRLVQIARYELYESPEAFTEAVTAMSKRIEAEGDQGLLRYDFFVNPEDATAGALIVYADSSVYIRHHNMVANWPEYERFYGTIQLVDLTFLGNLSPDVQRILDGHGTKYHHIGWFTAGFDRI